MIELFFFWEMFIRFMVKSPRENMMTCLCWDLFPGSAFYLPTNLFFSLLKGPISNYVYYGLNIKPSLALQD